MSRYEEYREMLKRARSREEMDKILMDAAEDDRITLRRYVLLYELEEALRKTEERVESGG